MKTIGERLKEARKKAQLSQVELAEKAGIKQATVSELERGASRSSGYIVQLANACGVSPEWLASGEESPDKQALFDSNVAPAPKLGGMAPLISWIQAGAFAESVIELNEDTEYYPRPLNASDQTFVLRVVGESMIDEYKPGTLIFVDPERAATSGDDVVAALEGTGEATFKRFIEDPATGKMLKALNSTWPNQFIPINGNCRIVGVVVAAMWLR